MKALKITVYLEDNQNLHSRLNCYNDDGTESICRWTEDSMKQTTVLRSGKWYKAEVSKPTPRTVYVKPILEADEIFVYVKEQFCFFYPQYGLDWKTLLYSCNKETAKRKFKFEEI